MYGSSATVRATLSAEVAMDTIFSVSSWLVLPVWFLMVFLPTWSTTKAVARSPYVSALAAVLYVMLIAPLLSVLVPELLHPTLGGMAAILGTREGTLAAW